MRPTGSAKHASAMPMQTAPQKNGMNRIAYSAPRYSSWRGSQISSSALNGSRSASAKQATAVMPNSAAKAANAADARASRRSRTRARNVPLAP